MNKIHSALSFVAFLATFGVQGIDLDKTASMKLVDDDFTPANSRYMGYNPTDKTVVLSSSLEDIGSDYVRIAWSFDSVQGRYALLTQVKDKNLGEEDMKTIGMLLAIGQQYYRGDNFATKAITDVVTTDDWKAVFFNRSGGQICIDLGQTLVMPSIRGYLSVINDGKLGLVSVADFNKIVTTVPEFNSGIVHSMIGDTFVELPEITDGNLIPTRIYATSQTAIAITDGQRTWFYGIDDSVLKLIEDGQFKGIVMQSLDEHGFMKRGFVNVIQMDEDHRVDTGLDATQLGANNPLFFRFGSEQQREALASK